MQLEQTKAASPISHGLRVASTLDQHGSDRCHRIDAHLLSYLSDKPGALSYVSGSALAEIRRERN